MRFHDWEISFYSLLDGPWNLQSEQSSVTFVLYRKRWWRIRSIGLLSWHELWSVKGRLIEYTESFIYCKPISTSSLLTEKKSLYTLSYRTIDQIVVKTYATLLRKLNYSRHRIARKNSDIRSGQLRLPLQKGNEMRKVKDIQREGAWKEEGVKISSVADTNVFQRRKLRCTANANSDSLDSSEDWDWLLTLCPAIQLGWIFFVKYCHRERNNPADDIQTPSFQHAASI